MIDFYNIQFYNQGSTRYESYTTLFEVAEGWSTGTTVREIWNAGIPLSKIVVGKPITKAGVVNSGFVPMDQLASFFQQAKSNGILPRGFMGWQWDLDVRELNGAWAPTLGAAWTGSSGSFPIPSSPLPIPSPSPQPPIFIPSPVPTTPVPVPTPQPIGGGTGNLQCKNIRTVQQGDTIFSIADQEQVLWEAIYVENQFNLPHPGSWELDPGTILRIPPCTTVPQPVLPVTQPVLPVAQPVQPVTQAVQPDPQPVLPQPQSMLPNIQPVEGGLSSGGCPNYIVQPSDTLDRIARSKGTTWQMLFDANKDQISNPDMIYVGQSLRIPQCA